MVFTRRIGFRSEFFRAVDSNSSRETAPEPGVGWLTNSYKLVYKPNEPVRYIYNEP